MKALCFKNKQNIVITGGGSGGHTAPLLAVVPFLQKEYNGDLVCTWIGSKHFEEEAAKQLGVSFIKIKSGKLRRYLSFQNIIDLLKVEAAFWQSLYWLIKLRPKVVVSTGGFVSVPVVIAAWTIGIPVVIHEQTIALGLANKISSFFAKYILIGFEESKKHLQPFQQKKVVVVGNPIRQSVTGGNFKGLKQSFDLLVFEHKKPLLYITGGSQGSQLINKVVWGALADLCTDFVVIHQCGRSGKEESKEAHKSLPKKLQSSYCYKVFLQEEVKHVYACADVVLARSGAGTVNELATFGIPSVFVPLKMAQQNEQLKNAQWFLKQNKSIGVIIEELYFTKESLLKSLKKVLPSQGGVRRNSKTLAKKVSDTSTHDFAGVIKKFL